MRCHFLKVWKCITNVYYQKKIAEFIAGRVANPTKEIMEAAYKKAQYVTFQTPLGKRGDLLDLAKADKQ